MNVKVLGLVVAVLVLGMPVGAWTQAKSASRTYGTQDETVHRLSAWHLPFWRGG